MVTLGIGHFFTDVDSQKIADTHPCRLIGISLIKMLASWHTCDLLCMFKELKLPSLGDENAVFAQKSKEFSHGFHRRIFVKTDRAINKRFSGTVPQVIHDDTTFNSTQLRYLLAFNTNVVFTILKIHSTAITNRFIE